MTKTGTARRLGRPPKGSEGESVARIIAAASDSFLKHGYAETSIDRIAITASISKKTFYDRFASKEDLFAEVARLWIEWDSAQFDDDLKDGDSVRERLRNVMLSLLRRTLKPEVLAFDRIISAEAVRFPELARVQKSFGNSLTVPLIEKCLKQGVESGELEIEDIAFAADFLLSAAIRGPLRKAVLAVDKPGLTPRHRKDLDRTIDLFLRGAARQKR